MELQLIKRRLQALKMEKKHLKRAIKQQEKQLRFAEAQHKQLAKVGYVA